jgi:hypothetical protein
VVHQIGVDARECDRVAAAVARDVLGPGERLGRVVEEEREAPDAGAARQLRQLAGDGAAIVAARVAPAEERDGVAPRLARPGRP